jgi:hypothetical protein
MGFQCELRILTQRYLDTDAILFRQEVPVERMLVQMRMVEEIGMVKQAGEQSENIDNIPNKNRNGEERRSSSSTGQRGGGEQRSDTTARTRRTRNPASQKSNNKNSTSKYARYLLNSEDRDSRPHVLFHGHWEEVIVRRDLPLQAGVMFVPMRTLTDLEEIPKLEEDKLLQHPMDFCIFCVSQFRNSLQIWTDCPAFLHMVTNR